jgi:CRP-like cAMP-binding protein
VRSFELRAWLEKILRKLDVVDAKVSAMPEVQVQVTSKFAPTLTALGKLGKPASAAEVAGFTGRCRAVESSLLNDLVGRGILSKERVGRLCLFAVREHD